MRKILAVIASILVILIFASCSKNVQAPYIQDGYWYINGTNTGVRAEGVAGENGQNGENGKDGNTPYIQDGYWYIDGVNTGVKAEGSDGEPGKNTVDIHNNEYNITVSPSFTTGSDAFLTSTNDSTDRSAEIAAILASVGFCQLGPGEFYVSNLHMPANSTLCGTGKATKIILPDELAEGYAIRVNSYCTVRDITVSGASSIVPSKDVGTRHGIVHYGTYSTDYASGGNYISISNVYINGFTGGAITFYNTGYSPTASIGVSDVTINNCSAGINISYWSEYHRFTNVAVSGCYYGCINNAGNNMFVNCAFNSNKIGFLMDNSNGDKPNNAHGSVIGCTFNHQDNNQGYAIKIYNTSTGFVFSGCQIFYGKTLIDNSQGIVFSACNFGRSEGIEINKGKLVLYANCEFGSAPVVSIESNEYVHFDNCYLRSGEALDQTTGCVK